MTRNNLSHKGENGKILIIGGSKRYVGALALAGLAALRVGADTVTIAAPEKVSWAINCLTPDLITVKLKGEYLKSTHAKEINELIKDSDVVVVGNGIGKKSDALVKKITKAPLPKVIDAEAIKAIKIQSITNSVITPHEKEFNLLLKNSKIKTSIQSYLTNNIILLKGPTDRIISKSETKLNHTGNAGMTKAGTGDVLAGLVAGFISQKDSLFDAAYKAAYYNGLIADNLQRKTKGYHYLASDIIKDIKGIV